MVKIPDSFLNRAKQNVSLALFDEKSAPCRIETNAQFDIPVEKQYILRMMIRNPETAGFKIPDELKWLEPKILELDELQKAHDLNNQFVYITVRHGYVVSETDDMWHTDGFSMRFPHVPEQNYIWSSAYPTEYADQNFPIPEDFDPFKHNLHVYLNDRVEDKNIKTLDKGIFLIDPYCVHRRPAVAKGMMRSFWRISFIPIEIEDDTCTENPLLPEKKYNRSDIRSTLIPYTNNV